MCVYTFSVINSISEKVFAEYLQKKMYVIFIDELGFVIYEA